MGTAYKFCDCKFNDTRLEENLPSLYNQDILKLNKPNTSFDITREKDSSLNHIEAIKRKNASNLIKKIYRQYKSKALDYSYQLNTSKLKSELNSRRAYNSSREKNEQEIKKETIVFIGEKTGEIKNGFGIKIMPNNAKYIGYFKNNKSHGYGKFINRNDIYYGEFSEDQANGFGIYRHKNETIYYGEWTNDLRHKYGVEKWRDKTEYSGEFFRGEKNGIGKYIFNDGSRYEGEWKNNCLDGYGIYYYLEQRIYIGEWKNNLKEGFGEFIWKDKIYIGFYSNDKKNGFGIYYWKNMKKAFIGFWKNGKQYGLGKLINNEKIKYGIWINDFLEIEYGEQEAFNELEKHKLGRYKYMFLFSLLDIDNYCREDGFWENLLEYSNQFTI